ncbi:mpv17-like protein isoform X2 [Juglans regia]|uniref:Mpv17-like protein isoform X2 n=2 Tax=Juglans regia TaxID=51240 RepID=A0A6P9EX83_JUGRE|nr:mpv17-like protein isoform X2 [Juglans regia]
MATLSITAPHKLPSLTKSIAESQRPNFPPSMLSSQVFTKSNPLSNFSFSTRKRSCVIWSVTEDREVVPVKENLNIVKDEESRLLLNGSEELQPLSTSEGREEDDDFDRLVSKAINASIVLGFGTFAVSKLLTIDYDYWHGWTLYEVLRYAPEHNWIAYEQALKANPVLAKMAISGIVYSLGDWIAQCYEGKPLFEFDRTRMFRSGLVGFTLHGSLSHYYYQFCEALFPFEDWWVVPAKVAFDQTVWAAVWNSIYFVVLGFLRFESPTNIFSELKTTFWPLLTAGWKLWPFAHLITYGLIPLEQRLLWVDCVELIWVTILSTYSNEKSEARISEVSVEANPSSSSSPKVQRTAVTKFP